jgi:SAM-dependent methyltransferase
MRSLDDVQRLVRERSPLRPEETEDVIRKRYAALPRRLAFALERWPLDRARVLDIGCSWGHCLVHFGDGSVGIDSAVAHVEFCRALGLDARVADANAGIDVPDHAFDYIWVSDVIEHLDAPRLLLRSVAPKLKADGRLILFLSVLPQSRLARAALRRKGIRPFDADAHHHQFTCDTAKYMVERAGYAVEGVAVPFGGHALAPLLRVATPRLYIEARPDPAAEAAAAAAEVRNRG